ncbi:hypothetical protein [Dysgonomonas sp. Marseille-P4677]|uniref:hypothetical protein n=1 Tax=Dysgonomonas sp. Marseille-P4677 TaxID=2364790 RepID=UPI00351C2F4B
MKVAMTPSAASLLGEVVVTGMTRTDKRMFSGAADRLEADKMMLSGVSDISRPLEGRSAGVSVQNVSGTFGTALKIRIRGATSIYGARAMSGVIVVTTKRGRAGTSSVNYTAELTSRMKPSYRNFNIMNSQDQMSIYKELEKKGWLNFPDVLRRSKSVSDAASSALTI